MRWHCDECGAVNGPDAAYCPDCGVAGPLLNDPGPAPGAVAGDPVHSGPGMPAAEKRITLVGSSTGVAPSLLDIPGSQSLMQPLPRNVRLSGAGWVALVGGWPELALCLITLPLMAVGVFAGGMVLGGLYSALLGIGGLALFFTVAFLYGASETSRTLRGYHLARHGWAAGGEIVRKLRHKGRFGSVFTVEFTFTDAQGVTRRSRQEITQEQWQAAIIHTPVTVLYDPRKPENGAVYEWLDAAAITPPNLAALAARSQPAAPSEDV